ncbi:MAG: class I SAM-dependent methyltransferase [Candidatus Berkelbacteria bacterium]|nr:class I SAM-dependent methyltransferase [Candidatus Berkelbacteria bacterium]
MTPTKSEEYLQLNPDAFTRFFICKEILKRDFGKNPIKLLDVGGGSKYFRSALKQDKLPYELTVLDILPPPKETRGYSYIQGDATKMEFNDNSFDAVVSMDVLEHVSDEKKPDFLQECYRVARELVIIAAPFESVETTQAETIANDFFHSQHERNHPWLIEHFEQNKPTSELMESEVKKFGCPYIQFESNHLQAWLKLILTNFVSEALVDPTGVRAINQFYNENLLRLGDFTAPGYRHFYVLYKNAKLTKDFSQYFKLVPSASDQLVLEQRMTELFVNKLKLDLDAQKAATVAVGELTTALEHATQNTSELRTALQNIQNSKSYKLARFLANLRRKIVPKHKS